MIVCSGDTAFQQWRAQLHAEARYIKCIIHSIILFPTKNSCPVCCVFFLFGIIEPPSQSTFKGMAVNGVEFVAAVAGSKLPLARNFHAGAHLFQHRKCSTRIRASLWWSVSILGSAVQIMLNLEIDSLQLDSSAGRCTMATSTRHPTRGNREYNDLKSFATPYKNRIHTFHLLNSEQKCIGAAPALYHEIGLTQGFHRIPVAFCLSAFLRICQRSYSAACICK
jgi:hypothetical protein